MSAPVEDQIAQLTKDLEVMRLRVIVAEHHKLLDRLGKSSYQEVVEEKLRVDLAEAQVGTDDLRASVVAIADEMDLYANLFDSRMDVIRAWAERLRKL